MSCEPLSDSSPIVFVDGADSSVLGPDSTTCSMLLLDDESSKAADTSTRVYYI